MSRLSLKVIFLSLLLPLFFFFSPCPSFLSPLYISLSLSPQDDCDVEGGVDVAVHRLRGDGAVGAKVDLPFAQLTYRVITLRPRAAEHQR